MMEFRENVRGDVMDEIALEGLEGITISALWSRLSSRKNFSITLDDNSKNFLWRIVRQDDTVEFFKLKEPRPLLINYSRYDNLDAELEVICEPEILPEDIYPMCPVDDPPTGNRGSCSTYFTRENVTPQIRDLTLDEADSIYGQHLVIVACQAARSLALGGAAKSAILDTLVLNSYIMLERIGRSREHGETTQGKFGLSRLNIVPKSAFYFRKRLLANGLIVKQPISMRIQNRNVLGTLLHLDRFYSLKLPKILVLIKRLIQILKESPPLYMLDYNTIRTRLNTGIPLKKILITNEIRQYVHIEMVTYRTLFPDAPEKEWKMKNGEGEKHFKVARLVDPSVDPEELFVNDDKLEDYEQGDSDEEDSVPSSGILTNASLQQHHYSIVQQAYKCLEAAGSEGLRQNDMGKQLGLSQLDSRSVLRVLTRLHLADCIVKEVKKNRVFLYVTTGKFGENRLRAEFEQEKIKTKELLQVTNNDSDEKVQVNSVSSLNETSMNNQLEKDVSLMQETISDEEGLFRPNIPRGILDEGETVADLTHRSLKRVNLILEAVRTHVVIEEYSILLRLIIDEEAKEGLHSRMDRRSLKRLLARLSNEGQIKLLRIILRSEEDNRTKPLNFICKPGIDINNSVVRSAVDQAKMKLFCIGKPQKKGRNFRTDKPDFGDKTNLLDPSVTKSIQQAKEELPSIKKSYKMLHNTNSGRLYGAEPKCVRVKELHRFFYYVVYGYNNINADSNQTILKEELKNENPDLEEELFHEMPDLYQSKISWQMFVSPLPQHTGWPTGWAFLCDILLRLPLSIFVKIVNITHQVEGLEIYLKHRVKQHYLLKHLPMEVRQGLVYARKYIFSVHEVVTNMVYLGLAQFGPHSLKEKDQVFIYLNQHTTLLDTTSSLPGYHHITRDLTYEKKHYAFESMEDVERYWYDVWNICSNTLLGSVNTMAGQSITLEMLQKKPAMIEALRVREAHEAPLKDNGEVPGDHLGAAGFDSAFFAHLKRNWTYSKSTVMTSRLEVHLKKSLPLVAPGNRGPSPSAEAVAPGRLPGIRSNVTRLVRCNTQLGDNFTVPVTVESNIRHTTKGQKRKRKEAKNVPEPRVVFANLERKDRVSRKPGSKIRVVKPRKAQAVRRPYYDDKDRQALAQMRKLRVNWTSVEDSFLLMCKVAGVYLNNSLRHMIPFWVVRDCLHETYSESRTKTSRACQRRVAYMMRNPTTQYQVVNAYQELLQEPDIETISGGGPITKEERTANGVEKTEQILIVRFRKMLEHLKPRYSQGGSTTSVTLNIPDSFDEFHQKYELTISKANLRHRRPITEVNNKVDVYCSVVYNVVHSSLCTNEDKTAYGFQLANIYQQYPDSLLRSTRSRMQNDMIIAHRKRHLKSKKFSQMPLSTIPYKLSITYIHMFLSRYQHHVFNESYIHLRAVASEKQKALTENNENWLGREVSLIHEGGNAAMVVTLFSLGLARLRFQIPEQIIIFDPKIKDNPEQFDTIVRRYNNLMKDADGGTQKLAKDELVMRRRLGLLNGAVINPPPPSTSDQCRTSEREIPEVVPSGSTNPFTSQICNNFFKHPTQSRCASRIGLHMLREDTSALASSSNPQIPQEHFVINSCQTFIDLPSLDLLENGLLISPQRRQEILDSIHTTITMEAVQAGSKLWERVYNDQKLGEEVKDDASRILELIALKKEMGIIASELPQAVGQLKDPLSCSLERHINLLVQSQALVRVGVVAVRFVCIQHSTPWVVQSFRLLRSGKEKIEPFNVEKAANVSTEVEVLEGQEQEAASIETVEENPPQEGRRKRRRLLSSMTDPPAKKPRTVDHLGKEDRVDLLVSVKPWVKIDGTLNRRVLDRLLGAVLSHVLLKPGCSVYQVAERFHPALQPFHTRELIEILENMGCLDLYGILQRSKPGPFSKREPVEIVPVDPFARDQSVFCDPKVDAILRLGEFIGEKKYEKDYIPKCTCHSTVIP